MLTTQGFRLVYKASTKREHLSTNTCVVNILLCPHRSSLWPLTPVCTLKGWQSSGAFLYQNIVLCVHKHFFFLLELHISQQLCHPLLLVPFLGEA